MTVAQTTFDHGAFDRLLHEHVVNGLVDYDAFAASPAFAEYLRSLAKFDPRSLAPDQRLAFWLNAYNAYTIQLVNSRHERESIRNIDRTLGLLKLRGPWTESFAEVAGKRYSLDEIEHRVIRKQFREPRIHFALVPAALGAAPLRSEAYAGDRLEQQLDDQTRIFLTQSPTKNRVDVVKKTIYLSRIFDYYPEDFGGTTRATIQFIARHHPDGPAKTLLLGRRLPMVETTYDWRLNAKPAPRTAQR
jgi:hypothetical protein